MEITTGTSKVVRVMGEEQESSHGGASQTYGLDPMLSVKEVADFLELNEKTVYAALTAGEIPGRKIGKRWVICRDALLDWLWSTERARPKRRR